MRTISSQKMFSILLRSSAQKQSKREMSYFSNIAHNATAEVRTKTLFPSICKMVLLSVSVLPATITGIS